MLKGMVMNTVESPENAARLVNSLTSTRSDAQNA